MAVPTATVFNSPENVFLQGATEVETCQILQLFQLRARIGFFMTRTATGSSFRSVVIKASGSPATIQGKIRVP